MSSKKRKDLPPSIDPTMSKYIRQVTGQEAAFSPANIAIDANGITEKQRVFLRAYGSSGGITKTALKESNSTRADLAEWLTQEPFKKAYKETQDDWVEELRKAAMLRATSKSDVLLMFLLKALRPDVFDEDVRKQQFVGIQNNKDAIPVRATLVRDNTINVSLTTQQADEIRDILTASEALESSDDF